MRGSRALLLMSCLLQASLPEGSLASLTYACQDGTTTKRLISQRRNSDLFSFVSTHTGIVNPPFPCTHQFSLCIFLSHLLFFPLAFLLSLTLLMPKGAVRAGHAHTRTVAAQPLILCQFRRKLHAAGAPGLLCNAHCDNPQPQQPTCDFDSPGGESPCPEALMVFFFLVCVFFSFLHASLFLP